MGCVLTLPATGSESNSGAVITRKSSGDKQHFFSPLVQPRFAVLDPVVTYCCRRARSPTAWSTPSCTLWSSI